MRSQRRRNLALYATLLLAALGGLTGCGSCFGGGGDSGGSGWAFMTLDATPRAAVTLDGELIGNTPLRKYAITAGEHEVILECVACPEPQASTLTFGVEPKEIYTHESTTFDMGRVEPVTNADTETPTASEVRPDPAYLTVHSQPWSVVFLDGALMGNTPLSKKMIDPGTHTMVLKCGPCASQDEITRTFVVDPGETHISMVNEFGIDGIEDPLGTGEATDDDDTTAAAPVGEGYLRITSTPWAEVTVDGAPIGKTPIASYTVPAGSHKANLDCGPCEEPQNELFLFSVSPGETYTIEGRCEN